MPALASSKAYARATADPQDGPPARFADLLAAEWIKFRSVRSSYWALLCAAVPSVLVGILIAQNVVSDWTRLTAQPGFHPEPLSYSFNGFQFSQLVAGVLGVMLIGSEYSSGLIRTTLAAVPHRRAVLAAKAAVLGALTLAAGEALAFAAFFPVQAILHGRGIGLSIASPGALRATLCAGLYLGVIALIGLALGTLLRHTAAGVAAVFGLVFVIPGVISAFPSPWDTRIGRFLPTNLAGQLIAQHPHPGFLSVPWSLTVLLAYPAVLLVAAGYALAHRDV
jgi:ABC-2 type transport system permease protein